MDKVTKPRRSRRPSKPRLSGRVIVNGREVDLEEQMHIGRDEQDRGIVATHAPFVRKAGETAADREAELDRDFLAWTSSPLGQRCMTYLRQTIANTVLPSTATSNELFYREGGRFVLGVIDGRAARGGLRERKSTGSGK